MAVGDVTVGDMAAGTVAVATVAAVAIGDAAGDIVAVEATVSAASWSTVGRSPVMLVTSAEPDVQVSKEGTEDFNSTSNWQKSI